MYGDIPLDGRYQLRCASKYAIGRYAAEDTLDHVEPRCGCRCEVRVEASLAGQ